MQDAATDAFYNAVQAWQELKVEQTGRVNENFRPIGIYKILEIAAQDEDIVEAIKIFYLFHPELKMPTTPEVKTTA